jgi:hypothetical protein
MEIVFFLVLVGLVVLFVRSAFKLVSRWMKQGDAGVATVVALLFSGVLLVVVFCTLIGPWITSPLD